MSSSITVFISTQVTFIAQKIALWGMFSPIIFSILKVSPYCVIWVLFTFIYIFMPNTKINFKSGLIGGIIAGTVYELVQGIYVTSQVGVAKYNAIYGSFAALPLFLIWLQLSWLILLFGAELSFAHMNVEMYEFEPDCLRTRYSFKKLLALRIVHLLVKNFILGNKPFTAPQISHTLEIPSRLVRQILFELVECGLISEIRTQEYKEVAYQPACDINIFSISYVINALEQRGVDDIPVAKTPELKEIADCLQSFDAMVAESPANKLLKNI
jgi:membrane protein